MKVSLTGSKKQRSSKPLDTWKWASAVCNQASSFTRRPSMKRLSNVKKDRLGGRLALKPVYRAVSALFKKWKWLYRRLTLHTHRVPVSEQANLAADPVAGEDVHPLAPPNYDINVVLHSGLGVKSLTVLQLQ